MVYYNADGSRASMCGNGLRCFAKFVYDNNIVKKEEFDVYTLDGIKKIKVNLKENKLDTIKVNMGKGSLKSTDIPVNSEKEIFINENIQILDKEFTVSSMLMGVPHTVIFVDNINMEDIHKYGPIIEKSEIFSQNTNVNFVKVLNDSHIFCTLQLM